jgi:cellulose synthase/poly-beta-1,6-N-acetylglucosamine synthase-like glycosyltransferase
MSMNQSKGGAESGLPLDVSNGASAPPTISIIIPTKGRVSLAAAILSALSQIDEHDEIIVVSDGYIELPDKVVAHFNLISKLPPIRLIVGPTTTTWGYGYPQKLFGIKKATKDMIMLLNDDDSLAPRAIINIKETATLNPNRPIIGLMFDYSDSGVYGKDHKIEYCHCSDVMLIVPNVPEKLGTYTEGSDRDILYVQDTLKYYPDGPVWLDEIIYDWGVYEVGRNKCLPK